MMSNAAEISEAFGEDSPQAAAPVDLALRHVVPAPVNPDIDKLEALAPRHRVLLVRAGAVIAVTTLISVGAALLLHLLAAGVIVIGLWFPWKVPGNGRVGQSSAGLADVGGSPGGFTILGDGPDDNAPPAPTAPDVLGAPPSGTANVLPALPETLAAPVAPAVASVQPLVQTTPALPPDLNAAPLAAPPASPPALPNSLQVASPAGPSDHTATPLNPGQPARGTGEGDGGGDDDRIMSLVKGDGTPGSGGGGVGTGHGIGHGSGIDRGLSAADRDPQLLGYSANSRNFTLPMQYQIKPPDRSVRLVLQIAPDGSIAGARLDQSCGINEVDQLVRDYVLANFHFSPAYRAGKAVAAEFPFEMSFKPFD